jgi:hypothetical protein
MTNYGITPTAKLDEITVAFRDGETEYSLIKEKLDELKKKDQRLRNLKN